LRLAFALATVISKALLQVWSKDVYGGKVGLDKVGQKVMSEGKAG
jgi:hypothetical protein